MAGCMVSFGGYNGRYHNSVHVYRPEGYVVVKAPQRAPSAAEPAERKPSANGGCSPVAVLLFFVSWWWDFPLRWCGLDNFCIRYM